MPAPGPHISTAKSTLPSNPLSMALVLLFVGLAALDIANHLGRSWTEPAWMAGALVMTGLSACIASLSPPLAMVNVIMAALLAGGIGSIAAAISTVTGYPLGPLDFTAAAGTKIANLLPWWMPIVWAIIALSSRGTARFLLQGQRQHPHHGYHVIAAASSLALISTILFNLFAARDDRYWHHAPAGSLFIYSGHILHLFIQITITALLIDKFPGEQPRNFRPLVVWLCTTAIFLVKLI